MTLNNYYNTLKLFEPISLQEIEKVSLLNRIDTKFILPPSQLNEILARLAEHYYILEINNIRASEYKTLYYDTPEFKFYHDHHNGRGNRLKIRHRTYVDSNTGFIEVKIKSNNGRTIKKRLQSNNWNLHADENAMAFIKSTIQLNAHDLIPVVWVNYKRITMVSFKRDERVTIDVDLKFSVGNKHSNQTHLVIAEVKQNKKADSEFVRLMKHLRIKEGSLSKYCLGLISVNNTVKTNNFKPLLLSLKKTSHAF